MWAWLAAHSEQFANWAEVSMAVTTIFAVGFAAGQISASKKAVAQSNALHAYQDYLKQCLLTPQYTSWEIFSAHSGIKDPSLLTLETREESERYLWFVSLMINASEQIIVARPNSGSWSAIIEAQLGYHREALSALLPFWKQMCSRRLQAILTRVLAGESPKS